MQQLKILNTREIKKIREVVVAEFGGFLTKDYAYLENEKGKVFLVNKDISRIELKNLRIDKMGLYFAEVKNNQVRLSKEGAQLLYLESEGKLSNIISLNNSEVKTYFTGVDLEKDLGKENKLVILEFNRNILGCAQYKERKILNFLPKIHRGEIII
ncbi:MAG: hypothetical protein KKH52_01865 [Nanoarchaeota archaeon]|nr:hypothetical protein [Nanoarchaeota archaeon]MBU1622809.1 hypothetical protein [Nanoarchaeota archaeon]MBU1974118.1 hypothetical protein [Nanoarchaeota archaeon]